MSVIASCAKSFGPLAPSQARAEDRAPYTSLYPWGIYDLLTSLLHMQPYLFPLLLTAIAFSLRNPTLSLSGPFVSLPVAGQRPRASFQKEVVHEGEDGALQVEPLSWQTVHSDGEKAESGLSQG